MVRQKSRYTGKKLLAAYIITLFPECALSIKKKDLSIEKHGYVYQVYDIAEKLIHKINDICDKVSTDVDDFIECVDKYTAYFNIFMSLDREKSISELVNHWCDTSTTMEEIEISEKYKNNTYQKNKVLEIVFTARKNIEKNIRGFDKNFDLTKLKSYYDMKKKVTNNVTKAFYDKLEEDIENNNFEHLGKLLAEIKDQIVMLQTNSPRHQENFKENFDVEFILQMIHHNAFGLEEFITHVGYIIDTLVQMSMPINEDPIKNKWKNMRDKIEKGEIGGFSKVVPYTFKFIYNQITEINGDIIRCGVMLNLGLNIFHIN